VSKEAWGRWGKSDECGAANLIGKEEVRRAVALVKSGKIVPLAQTLSSRLPVPGHRAPMQHFMGRDGGDYAAGAKRANGFQFAEDTIILSMHIGTHIDALCHAWYEDYLYNGFAGGSIRSVHGALHCGVEKIPPIVTRGVLLDMVQINGGPLADGTSIGRPDLERAAASSNIKITKGDAVLIRTGWQEARGVSKDPSFDAEPGIDVEAAIWLAEADVALIGADNYAIEVLPFPVGTTFPVHQRLLRDYGIPLLEGMVLNTLAEQPTKEFLFILNPLPIAGATGSPVAPIAVF
jgi:kynurenine formamidase